MRSVRTLSSYVGREIGVFASLSILGVTALLTFGHREDHAIKKKFVVQCDVEAYWEMRLAGGDGACATTSMRSDIKSLFRLNTLSACMYSFKL